MISAVSEMREEPQVEGEGAHALEGDFADAGKGRLEKIAGDGNDAAEVISITDATCKISTGKWVYGHENSVATTPSLPHLKAVLVNAELRNFVVAFGGCSGAFHQDRRLDGGHGANTVEELEMVRGHYDGCLFMKLSNMMMAGRRADDFRNTGPSDEADMLLWERLALSDVVKLTQNGDQATFMSMQVEKVEGGYTTSGKTSLIDDILKELGLETAKPSTLPKTTSEMHAKGDEVKLDAVGPTGMDLRRLKKMALYLAGTRDYRMQLIPDKGRQGCVALRSAESELYALGSGAAEALGLASLLDEWKEKAMPLVMGDRIRALHIVRKRGPGMKKYVGMRFLAPQQRRERGRLSSGKACAHENPSDVMTKPMTREKLEILGGG
ncbi:unnamed protein product, partial [Prorocentrum cordatum]